jgi:hypothetical protein
MRVLLWPLFALGQARNGWVKEFSDHAAVDDFALDLRV